MNLLIPCGKKNPEIQKENGFMLVVVPSVKRITVFIHIEKNLTLLCKFLIHDAKDFIDGYAKALKLKILYFIKLDIFKSILLNPLELFESKEIRMSFLKYLK